MTHRVIAPLGLLLALAGSDSRIKICDATKNSQCAAVSASGQVSISGSISASTTGRATAAAPTYSEGTDNPLSIDLSGNIRTLATAETAAKATAANPSYTEGTTNPISQDLSGHLRALSKQDGSWTNACTQSGTWTVQPGNTANTTAWKVDGSAVTQPVSGTFWQATQPVSIASMPSTPVTGTFWQATQPVSGTFWQATQPVSGTVAVSNSFALDATLTGGTQKAIVRGGAKGATAAADVTSTANGADHQGLDVAVQGTVPVSAASLPLPTGASTEATLALLPLAQGSTTSGQKGPLVQAAVTNTPPSYTDATTAPLSMNLVGDLRTRTDVAKVAGSNTVTGGLAGTLGVGGTAGNNAAITQNPLIIGFEARSSTPTAATNGNQIRGSSDLAGNVFVVQPIAWTCNLQALAASLTQCQAAPGAGFSLYVTNIIATTTTTTAGTFAIRYGTGSNCATTPIGVWPQPGGSAPSRVVTAPISTAAPMVLNLGPVGQKLAAANALCVIGTATNTIDISIMGYTAP